MTIIKTACLLTLVSAFAFAAEGWMTDYDAALKKAKAENKVVILDFSGSDWCVWCVRLDNLKIG
ncbi:MAG: thioredoxin family protein [Lentisphaeria bacterium]|nr:thioredoxin family protein [Lentisphaeria bacterium]